MILLSSLFWLSLALFKWSCCSGNEEQLDLYKAQELDVSWDFNDNQDLQGWGNSTAEEMNMEVKSVDGELRCSIIGFNPKLESPRLFLNVSRRHYVVMRAKYLGAAQDARLLLRSGGSPSPAQQLDLSHSYWSERQRMVPISASTASTSTVQLTPGSVSSGLPHDKALLADGRAETYYLSTSSKAVNVVLDLGSQRWVTALRMSPIGDSRSPKRCVLQQSVTNGVGPFETVKTFTIRGSNSSSSLDAEEQRVAGFNGYARYWRLIVLDNYGGSGVGIREVSLDGYDDTVTPVPFSLRNTGQYETYYLPISTYLSGMLLRMRLELVYTDHSEVNPHKSGKVFREGLYIDHIRVVRAPEVWKVRGCLDKYYPGPSFQEPTYNVTTHINRVNGNLPVHYFSKNNLTLQYASTYDCPLQGGPLLLVEGINFGMHPRVTVGGRDCPVLRNEVWSVEGRVQQLTCRLPPGESGPQRVRVLNGVHPGKTLLIMVLIHSISFIISNVLFLQVCSTTPPV